MSFRLVPKSVTLNDLERRKSLMALILRYFSDSFRGALRKLVEGVVVKKSSRSVSHLLMSSCHKCVKARRSSLQTFPGSVRTQLRPALRS